MAGLNLFLLGGFQAYPREGPALCFQTNKAKALLAFLVCEAFFPHSRDALAGLLWPENPQDSALTNLRSALFTLRQTIQDYSAQPPFLNITRETIQFNIQSNHWLDLTEFQQRLSADAFKSDSFFPTSSLIQSLEYAISLYRGAFLEGFPNIGSAQFEEWILQKRGQFHEQALHGLQKLADHYEAQGDFQATITCIQREIELEPWQEEAHQQLMRIFVLNNQRSKALSQFEICRFQLQKDLGVEPSISTLSLYEQIKAGESFLSPKQKIISVSDLPITPAAPFYARKHELSKIDQSLQMTLNGEGRIIFVTGEPGCGKTALMTEFMRRSVEVHPKLIAACGKCNAYNGIGDPYLPFREILEMLSGHIEAGLGTGNISGAHARRLSTLAPLTLQSILDYGPDLINHLVSGKTLLNYPQYAVVNKKKPSEFQINNEVTGNKHRVLKQIDLFRQYTRVLQNLSLSHPLLLVVDDLQWIDEGSLSLLFHLGRRLTGKRILILAAYRPEEVFSSSRDGERHLLEPILNEFQRDFGDILIDLDQAEGGEFIDAWLDREPNRLELGFRQQLYQHTRGNPLFTIEFIQGLKNRGDLVQEETGLWIIADSLNWDNIPFRVEAVISEKIARLPQSWRRALTIASVEGEDFIAEVVAQIQEEDDAEILQILSGPLCHEQRVIDSLGLLQIGDKRLSHFRFHHILFQKHLYTNLNNVERACLHEAVGLTIERLYKGQAEIPAAHLAWHFEEAGVIPKAIAYYQLAAIRSVELTANADAVTYYRHALELLDKLPESPTHTAQELELQMGLAVPLVTSQGYSASVVRETYDRAYQLCLQLGNAPQLVPVLLGLGSYYSLQARYSRAKEAYQQILTIAKETGDPETMMIAHWQLGYINLAAGKPLIGRDLLENALKAYKPGKLDPHVYFQEPGISILTWLARALWVLGYPDQSSQRSQQALKLASEYSEPFSSAFAYGLAANLSSFRQNFNEAILLAQKTIEISSGYSFPVWEGFGRAVLGGALAEKGNIPLALQEIYEGIELIKGVGACQALIGCLNILANTLIKAKQPEKALEYLNEALQMELASDGEFNLAHIFILKGDLLLLLCAGEEEAESCFLQAIEIARHQDARSWELRGTLALCHLWHKQGKGASAHEYLTKIYSWFSEGFSTPDLLAARVLLENLSPVE